MKETKAQKSPIRWTTNGVRPLVFAAAVALLTAAGACGGDSPNGPSGPKTPDGTYAISTINGKNLPAAVFSDTDFTFEITSGTLTLTTDGQFSAVTNSRLTVPGNVSNYSDTSAGTWLLSGSSIQFTSPDAELPDSAAWSNGQITFTQSDGATTTTIVYKKN